ncbi:hypothetical protein [uncultured Algoriphagus sp.]|uniref:hypothetical protein n=1 Tax=uncultured Algoriphagus sp. TaxID=417365 RepID=UPI00259AC162|nr:hypothetical protein [uncultured Algoriphagus sp.]
MEDSNNFQAIHIGERLKTLLRVKGISQAKLAEALGKHAQNINRAMLRSSMTTDFLQEIMHATGIRSWEIFEHRNPEITLYEEMLSDKRELLALKEELSAYRNSSQTTD